MNDPFKSQVDGQHYLQGKIQPCEYARDHNFGYWQSQILRYLTRVKAPRRDREKLVHSAQCWLAEWDKYGFPYKTKQRIQIALEGPIQGCTDAECIDWRKEAMCLLGDDYDYHNPMDLDCRGREAEMEAELVSFDEAGIAASDIVLVMATRPGWGTAIAVEMAYMLNKTIVTVFSGDKPSPWLKNRSDIMVQSLEAAVETIRTLKDKNVFLDMQ